MKKVLKIIGLSLAGIIAVVLIVGLLLPKSMHIERSILVDAPSDVVYPHVSSLRSMHAWSPWVDYDPEMNIAFEGDDGAVGSVYRWEGTDQVGKGYQTITSRTPESIEMDLIFIEPWQSNAKTYILLDTEQGKSKITWGYKEKTPLPANVMMKVMGVKPMLEKEFDKGLAKLKEQVEG